MSTAQESSVRFDFLRQFQPNIILPYLNVYEITRYHNGVENYVKLVDAIQNSQELEEFVRLFEQFPAVATSIVQASNHTLINSPFPNYNSFLQWLVFQYSTNFVAQQDNTILELLTQQTQTAASASAMAIVVHVRQPKQNEIFMSNNVEFLPDDQRNGHIEFLDFSSNAKNMLFNASFFYESQNAHLVNHSDISRAANTLRKYLAPGDQIVACTYQSTQENNVIWQCTVGTSLNQISPLHMCCEQTLFSYLKTMQTHATSLNAPPDIYLDTIQSAISDTNELIGVEAHARTGIACPFANFNYAGVSCAPYNFFYSARPLTLYDAVLQFTDAQQPLYINYSQAGINLSATQSPKNGHYSMVQLDFKALLSVTRTIEQQKIGASVCGIRFLDAANAPIYEFGWFWPETMTTTQIPLAPRRLDTLNAEIGIHINLDLDLRCYQEYCAPINSGCIILNTQVDQVNCAAVMSLIQARQTALVGTLNAARIYYTNAIAGVYAEPPWGVDFVTYNFFHGGEPVNRINNYNNMLSLEDSLLTINTGTNNSVVPTLNVKIDEYVVYYATTFWALTNAYLKPLTNAWRWQTINFSESVTLKRLFTIMIEDLEFGVFFKSDAAHSKTTIYTIPAYSFAAFFHNIDDPVQEASYARRCDVPFACVGIAQSPANQNRFVLVTECGAQEQIEISYNYHRIGQNYAPYGAYYNFNYIDELFVAWQTSAQSSLTTPFYENTFTQTKFFYSNGVVRIMQGANTMLTVSSFANSYLSANRHLLANNQSVALERSPIADPGVTPVAFFTENIGVEGDTSENIQALIKLVYLPMEYSWFLICNKTPLFLSIIQNELYNPPTKLMNFAEQIPVLLYFLLKKPTLTCLTVFAKQSTQTYLPHSFQLWYALLLNAKSDVVTCTENLLMNVINFALLYKTALLNWYSSGLPAIDEYDTQYKDFFTLLSSANSAPIKLSCDLEAVCINQYKLALAQSQIFYSNIDVRIYKNSSVANNKFLQALFSLLPYTDIIFDSYTAIVPPIYIDATGNSTNTASKDTFIYGNGSEFMCAVGGSSTANTNINYINSDNQIWPTNELLNKNDIQMCASILFNIYSETNTSQFSEVFVSGDKLNGISAAKLIQLFSNLKASKLTPSPTIVNLLQSDGTVPMFRLLKNLLLTNTYIYGAFSALTKNIYLPIAPTINTPASVVDWLTTVSNVAAITPAQAQVISSPLTTSATLVNIFDVTANYLYFKLPVIQYAPSKYKIAAIVLKPNFSVSPASVGVLQSNVFLQTSGQSITPNDVNDTISLETMLNCPASVAFNFAFNGALKNLNLPVQATMRYTSAASGSLASITGVFQFTIAPTAYYELEQVKMFAASLHFENINIVDLWCAPFTLSISQDNVTIFELALSPRMSASVQMYTADVYTQKMHLVNEIALAQNIDPAFVSGGASTAIKLSTTETYSFEVGSMNVRVTNKFLINYLNFAAGILVMAPVDAYKSTYISFKMLINNSAEFARIANDPAELSLRIAYLTNELYYIHTAKYTSLQTLFFGGQTQIIEKAFSDARPSLADNYEGLNVWYLLGAAVYYGTLNVYLPFVLLPNMNYKLELKSSKFNVVLAQIEFTL